MEINNFSQIFSTTYDHNFKLQFYLDDAATSFFFRTVLKHMSYMIKKGFSRLTSKATIC